MKMIAAVNNKWAIGRGGGLIYSIPEDMRFFREITSGKIVVMGRSTLDSFPGGKPLKNRVNIVLSRTKSKDDGVIVCGDINALLTEIRKYHTDDVFVIGGESVYFALLDYCNTAYITKVLDDTAGEKYFPNIDALPEWTLESQSPLKHYENLDFTFCTYVRHK